MGKVLPLHCDPVYQLSRHLKKNRRKVYVALEWMDHIWDEKEVERVRYLWSSNVDYRAIAREMNREEVEIVALILDQIELEKLKMRKGGVWGTSYIEIPHLTEAQIKTEANLIREKVSSRKSSDLYPICD